MQPLGQAVPAFVQLAAHPVRWQLLTHLSGSDLRVRELVELIGQPQNLVSYHLRLLRNGGVVTVTRSSFDGRDSYYHLDLDRCADLMLGTGPALHPALRMRSAETEFDPPVPPSVLFACTGNSARSVIAEELLRDRAGGRVEVFSAGSRPAAAMQSNTVRVLQEEFGIDIAGRAPQGLSTFTGRRFDGVITLCDKVREVCPEFDGGGRRVHWSIPDPAASGGDDERTYPIFRDMANEIDTRVRHLLAVLAADIPHERSTA
jgi:ArsR family transcriptional regulator, arsenate/arsenite/antimonite-responsive transcriptional repressor / arsenate reductase (thioredoxin)